MNETRSIMCPECDTPNSIGSPFCENCGYRLRARGTMREGHPVITPELVARYPAGERAPGRDERTVTGADPRANSKDRADTEPERPEVSRKVLSQNGSSGLASPSHSSSASAPGKGSRSEDDSTVLEGLEPVPQQQVGLGETTDVSDEFPKLARASTLSPYESGSFTLQREERTMSVALIASAWLVSTGALMLLTYYLTVQSADEPVELRADSQKVTLESGEFLKGLNEQVRAFILMTCQKIGDDSHDCTEDELLDGEFPEETVELEAFQIDNLEVHNGAWARCVEAEECPEINYRACRVYTTNGLQVSLRVPKQLQESQMPVSCVTKVEAETYCRWAGGTLPTADQWERAARGTRGRIFPWGDAWRSEVVNWGEVDVIQNSVLGKIDGYEWAAPPGSFPDGASPDRIYDMAGNVWEWVRFETDSVTTGVARGGSWASNPFELRTTGRLELPIDARRADVGFRCAYEP